MRGRSLARASLLLVCVALAVSIVAPSAAFAEKTIALSSGSFSFEIDPGQTGSGEVVVINDGDEDIKVLVYVADVEISDTGEQSFPLPEREGANLLSSPATWMRVYMPEDSKAVGNTPYLELKPGQRVPVKFDFTPPRDANPGDHNIVMFFEMFDFLPESAGSASQVSGRIGARVQLRVKGQFVEKVEVRPFEVPAFQIGNSVPYRFTITNSGNVNERLSGTVSLLDRNEREVVSAEVASDTPVYAGSSLEISGEVTSVVSVIGPHTVEVLLQYLPQGASTPEEVVVTRTVWMFPLWLLIAVAASLFALVIWIGWRAARKRRGPGGPTHTAAPVPPADDDSYYDPDREAPGVTAPSASVARPATDAHSAPGAPSASDVRPEAHAPSVAENQDALQLEYDSED